MNPDVFSHRHIGPDAVQVKEMLEVVGVNSIDELIDQTVPNNIRLHTSLNLEKPLSEQEFLEHIYKLGAKNKVFPTFGSLSFGIVSSYGY